MNASEPFLVDSNILIYAHDIDAGTKYEKALGFILQKREDKMFFTSIQNLAEFYFNITKKIHAPLSHQNAKEILFDFSKATIILHYNIKTLFSASDLQAKHKIHFWDALLVATMLENNISIIYTENTKDFKKIPGIKVINPLA